MPSLSLKAESWGNTFRISACAPVGFTLEWLVNSTADSTIMPSLCLYSVITGPPVIIIILLKKKRLIAGQKECCHSISCESTRRGYLEMFYKGSLRLELTNGTSFTYLI